MKEDACNPVCKRLRMDGQRRGAGDAYITKVSHIEVYLMQKMFNSEEALQSFQI